MGTYRLSIEGSVSLIAQTAESQFNLIVYPEACRQEFVSPDGALGPITYEIGKGL